MSSRSPLAQERLNNNGGIKFALGSVPKEPESTSSKAISEKLGGSSSAGTREKGTEDVNRHGRLSSHFYTATSRPAQHDRDQARSARTPVRTIPGIRLWGVHRDS